VLVEVVENRDLPDRVEAVGFFCTAEATFTHEDEYEVGTLDTDVEGCANCGEVGVLIAVQIVQRDS